MKILLQTLLQASSNRPLCKEGLSRDVCDSALYELSIQGQVEMVIAFDERLTCNLTETILL